MRKINYLVVHCTATQPNATPEAIQNYWKTQLGWKSPGYHILIQADGTAVRLLPDTGVSNGVAGHNANSLHVSYIGGIDAATKPKDTRTPAQKATILRILQDWKRQHPTAIIQGHRDFPGVNKACPSFDAKTEYAGLK